jgi:hypothetical protein
LIGSLVPNSWTRLEAEFGSSWIQIKKFKIKMDLKFVLALDVYY